MGLVDDTRKRRDSWIKRFEEMRQEEEWSPGGVDPKIEEERIMENRRKVGVFPPKPKDN